MKRLTQPVGHLIKKLLLTKYSLTLASNLLYPPLTRRLHASQAALDGASPLMFLKKTLGAYFPRDSKIQL